MTLHSLLRRLVGRAHSVRVLNSRPMPECPGDYRLDGVQVLRYQGQGDPNREFSSPNTRPDVVIAHLENTPRAAALADEYQVPMVHLIHNDHLFTMAALNRGPAQLAVFNTEWNKEAHAGWWPVNGNGAFPPHLVVHPPVHGKEYAAVKGPHDRVTLINLNEDKGGKLFWELATRMPDVKFLGVRGAYGEQMEGIGDNVEVLDHLPPGQMASEVYGRTKLLLMPSGYESYGRTAIEAAHSGIPTIAHPTLGLLEALGGSGFFVDRDDTDGWVQKIRGLLKPPAYKLASADALALAERKEPTADLDRFVNAMEGVARRGIATVFG